MTQSIEKVESKQKVGVAMQVAAPNSELKADTRQFGMPGRNQVLLKLQACGVCHSDSFAVHGGFPGLKHPIVPGHEIVGVVEEVGSQVIRLKKGDRVGVGWHGGHCGECPQCRRGDFIVCNKLETPGITRDGGYSEYAIFPEAVCAAVPAELTSAEAAPLMCAGVTTFNALRHSGARPGDVVAILGLGGLGHLGVQFANAMGFFTVGIARGSEKAEFAKKLGAKEYIDSESNDAVETLKKLGGAKVLLSTITSSKAMTPWIDALSVNGKMVLVGADMEPMQVSPIALLGARRSITGWPSGTAMDSEDCMRFAAQTGIRPMIESYDLKDANQAYQRMMSGKAKFRVVLNIGT